MTDIQLAILALDGKQIPYADIIVDALRKQMPMAPKEREFIGLYVYFCPSCKKLVSEDDKHCSECGQRLERGQ